MASEGLTNVAVSVEDGGSPSCSNVGSPSSGPSLPVKNTFIHFGGLHKQNRSRVLRRWRTDPGEPVDNASDSGSTTEPAESETDPLEPAMSALASLDFQGISSQTPEHTPRYARDPWASPVSSSAASEPPMSVVPQSPLVFATIPPQNVIGVPQSPVATAPSSSVSSSLSSSPASSTYLNNAFNSLGGAPSSASTFLEGGFCFGFTLRLADEVGLGVDLAPRTDGTEALIIQGVLQKGAIAAWNKQCFDGTANRCKAIWPGDTIVSVNGKTQYSDMIQECETKMLQKLTVFRAVCDDGSCMGRIPTGCYWPSSQMGSMMFKSHGGEGQRLHSSKTPVTFFQKP